MGRTCRRAWVAVALAVCASALIGCSSGGGAPKRHASTSTRSSATSTTATTRALPPEGWEQLPPAPGALGKYAVWTGSEYVGGPSGCCDDLGGTEVYGYSASAHAWRALAPFPLAARSGEGAVWTGHEMIVVGGKQAASADDSTATDAVPTATGAALDPAADTWRTIAPMPEPMQYVAGAVWTGSEVLVFDTARLFRYDPVGDRWSTGAPPPFLRSGTATVWSGKELLVWAGADVPSPDAPSQSVVVHDDGAAYDPATNSWRAIAPAPVPARTGSTGVWTGSRLIVWGGYGSDGPMGAGNQGPLGKGASYDPATNTWAALPASPLKARGGQQMVWTGREVLVWGGQVAPSEADPDPLAVYPRDGAAYDPAARTWRRMPTAPPSPPSLLTAFSVVWTGDVALFVGGADRNAQGVGPLGLSYAPGR